ncbi:glycoside hydrolase family 44 protein, partial [Cohnella suwonensis]
MRKTKWFAVVVSAAMMLPAIVPWAQTAHAADINVSITVDPTAERANISPYIYGTNQDFPNTADYAARRLGGNRLTGYNWENNASNAGSDWQHSSDDYLCSSSVSGCTVPGAAVSNFHDTSVANGSYSLVTLQMAGYVAADKNGAVSESETAPSSRWRQAPYAKGSPFSLTPDTSDGSVYMDEEVNFLVNKYGSAATSTGIRGYSLDNEPALWATTHPRIHPAKVGAQELVDRSVALSKAVKAVDPAAEIFGPALYGFYAYYGLQEAPDWPTVKGNYDWYIDYYLDKMKQASATEGKRLLDTLDVHWYPEAQGGGQRIVFGGTGSVDTQKARVQAPRTLWDPTYLENSWIASSFPGFLPIIPRLKSSIDAYYPGTKLAITEYSYGGEGDISGGIAQADALGAFGKYGLYFASFWKLETNSDYVNSAFKLFRNYDGNGSKFGDVHVKADTSDVANSSVYASVKDDTNSELHLIVVNKSFDSPLNANIQIAGGTSYTSGAVYGFDGTSTALNQAGTISSISGNQFTYSVPPLTAYHIVLQAGNPTPPSAPTGLTATAGNAQASLSWSASAGATSYNVKRATTSGGPYTTVATGVTATGYADTGLSNGTTYYYVVSAANAVGESANSSQVSATPSVPTIPPAPTGLTATAGNAQVALSWTASAGATSYTVKRATTSGGPYTNVA